MCGHMKNRRVICVWTYVMKNRRVICVWTYEEQEGYLCVDIFVQHVFGHLTCCTCMSIINFLFAHGIVVFVVSNFNAVYR